MSFKKKFIFFILLVVIIGVGKYAYDMHINHNFETITEGKVYKSGVIPPDEIEDYVKKYGIKDVLYALEIWEPKDKKYPDHPELAV
jgi:hypothetical protein